MSASKEDILQYGLRNKSESIKIIAETASKSIFRWVFAYSLFAFDNVFFENKEKRGQN